MSLTPSGNLPRLLYIGDVPVSGSVAGATLLYRLLRRYPAERLVVCGPTPRMGTTLPGVRYIGLDPRWPRILRTRFSGLYCSWVTWRQNRTTPRWLRHLAKEFRPEAVLTISQTGGWLLGWRLAQREKLPLHLIAHDDHAFSTYLPERLRPWADRNFTEAYRFATARFCISPAMAEAYAQRYGVPGQVIYPTRDPADPVFADVAPRALAERESLTFAYAGSIYGDANFRKMVDFARVAGAGGHRLLVYSPQHPELKSLAGANAVSLDARAPVPSAELLRRLRDEADCLLVTGSFEPEQRAVVSTLFPSKVADYSAVGLPILAWAPEYASITRFVREHPGCAELVTSTDAAAATPAFERLAASAEHRRRLGENILAVGLRCFSPEAAWETFSAALRNGPSV